MLNKSGGSSAYGATAILLALLIMFIIFLMLAPPEFLDELNLTYVPEYSSIVLLETPGSLYVQNISQESETYIYDIGTISVDNFPKSSESLLIHQGIIKNSLFKNEVLSFDFDVKDLGNLNKIYLSTNIIGKSGSGELIVTLNDVVIYSREIYTNSNLNLELPIRLINEMNILKISVSSPGFAFWNTNAYALSNIYLIKEEYSSKSERSELFFLDRTTTSDVRTAKFMSYVSKKGSDDSLLKISINNKIIYSGIPGSRLEVQFPNSYLVPDTNELKVETSRNGKYELRYMYLHLETTKISDNAKIARYSFDLDIIQWEKVQDKNYACQLFLRKTSGKDDRVTVEINNNLIKRSFDSDFTLVEDICYYLKENNNILRIIPENNVVLDLLKFEIKNK